MLEYALRLDADRLTDGALVRSGQDYRTDFLAGDPFEPPLALEGDVVFSCLKGAEDGDGLVLRLVNPGREPTTAAVRGAALRRLRLDETHDLGEHRGDDRARPARDRHALPRQVTDCHVTDSRGAGESARCRDAWTATIEACSSSLRASRPASSTRSSGSREDAFRSPRSTGSSAPRRPRCPFRSRVTSRCASSSISRAGSGAPHRMGVSTVAAAVVFRTKPPRAVIDRLLCAAGAPPA